MKEVTHNFPGPAAGVGPGWFDRLAPWALVGMAVAGVVVRVLKTLAVNTSYDGFGYIMIARSLLAGRLATPYICKEIALHFDPLYPLIIAGFSYITGDLFSASRAGVVVFGALLAIPIWGLGRDAFGTRAAVFAVALWVAHPFLVRLSANPFSESPYLFFGMMGLWWWRRLWTGGGRLYGLGGAAMFALAYLTRAQGMALFVSALGATLFVWLLERPKAPSKFGRQLAVSVLLFIVLILPYQRYQAEHAARAGVRTKVWQELHKKFGLFGQNEWSRGERSLNEAGDRLQWIELASESGLDWIRDHPAEYLERVRREFFFFAATLFRPDFAPALVFLPIALLLIVDLLGRDFRSGAVAFALLQILGAIVALALWAVANDRYLSIALPLALVLAGGGLAEFDRLLLRLGRRVRAPRILLEAAPFALVAACLFSYPQPRYLEDIKPEPMKPDQEDRAWAAWAAKLMDPTRPEIVMATKPSVPALTGDYFFLLPIGMPDRVADYARAQGADYLLIESRYLSLQRPDAAQVWVDYLRGNDFSDLGLELLGHERFQKPGEQGARQLFLFRVTAVDEKKKLELSDELLATVNLAPPAGDRPPSVILISLDTLRADHLGSYGYERPTSPNLDLIARHGVRFERAISQSPKTAPAHMTIFTGLYPQTHQTHLIYDPADPTHPKVTPLAPAWKTLPEWLSAAGYRTAAWTAGGQVGGEAGFARGFGQYHEGLRNLFAASLFPARTWLGLAGDAPAFVFLHTYQIHDPYTPPAPYDRYFDPDYNGWIVGSIEELRRRAQAADYFSVHRVFWGGQGEVKMDSAGEEKIDRSRFSARDLQHLVALYDGGIRYTDAILGEFVARLAAEGSLDDTLLIITSDHGEEFLEHGDFLHKRLYRETLEVPLILFYPGVVPAGKVVKTQVRSIDLLPTILEFAGLAIPEQVQGQSLMPLIMGPEEAEDRPAFSEDPFYMPTHHRTLRDRHLILYDRNDKKPELFDHDHDPNEQHCLASARPEDLEAILALLEAFLLGKEYNPPPPPGLAPATPQPLSPERIRQLKDLGYLK